MASREKIEAAVQALPPLLQKDIDENLCVCNEVKKATIIGCIVEGADSVEAVRQCCYATDGNGCCTRQVKRLVECLTDVEL